MLDQDKSEEELKKEQLTVLLSTNWQMWKDEFISTYTTQPEEEK